MTFSPIYVGQTHKALALTWLDDSKNPVDLTGASLAVRFSSQTGVPAPFTGGGSFVITNAAQGQFTYQLASSDVAVAGSFRVQFVATYGDQTKTFSDEQTVQILPDV